MKEKNKKLIENTIATGALHLIMCLFPLITLPYQTRVLGVENYGLVAFAASFIQYFVLFIDYGFELSATKEISSHRENKKVLSNIFNSVLVSKTLLFFTSIIIMLILTFSIPQLRENWLLMILSFITVIGNVIYPVWFFVGIEHMKYITFLNILSRTIFMVLLFIFIKNPDDYLWMPILTSTGSIVAGIISLYVATKRFDIKIYIPKWKSVVHQLKYSTQFFFTRLSSYGTANTNTFCLGLIGSKLAVGYYVAAYNIFWAVNVFSSSFEAPFFPYMNKNKDLKLFKKIFFLAFIGFGIMSLFLYIFAKPIITVFYGQPMMPAYNILKIFCINLFVLRIAGIIGYPLLGAFGHIKTSNNISIFSSLCHFAGLFILFLTHHLTMFTIAWLIVISNSINLILKIFYIFKYKIFSVK
ncbi:MAG: oligosaccharide flippase family protein [Candidatus Gastranaerophilaceae bacterium]